MSPSSPNRATVRAHPEVCTGMLDPVVDARGWFPLVAQADATLISTRDRLAYDGVQSRAYCLVTSGTGHIVVNGIGYEVGPRSLIGMPWGHHVEYRPARNDPLLVSTVHLIPRHDAAVPVTLRVAHAPDDPLWDSSHRQDLPALPQVPFQLRHGDRVGLALLIAFAAHYWGRGDVTAMVGRHIGAVLLDEVLTARRRLAPQYDPNLPPTLRRAIAWAVGHVHRSFKLADLCAAAGVSPTTLGRLFRCHLGAAPMTWVQHLRLERGARLLREGTLTVGQVARRVGFADAEYFARLFRRRYRMTPGEWRRRSMNVP
ncbi:helix-turn-helix domain-containing protein [Jiangella asiatica]|uniref:AraC family transcriptional regulator n=1 Tax=Jiangella asiatica TaxID=2530372 RepID=A0A4R5DN00_9ACTN|nr:AraC family transcriptional regulator [Jiangella asiatica]TDE14907.1 AraC family transcriptional regulator [Jiangella asiatica]